MDNDYYFNNNELKGMQLSICIPTFNRATFLQDTLSRLADQVSCIEGGGIEILVGDNHSDDGTEIIGRQYSDKYPYISYCRNDGNIGGARNTEKLIQGAKGTFIWLLSDDDDIEDEALKKIMQVISQQDVAFIFVNYALWSADLQGYIGSSRCIASNDCIANNADEFYSLVRYANSFMSSCIFNRDQWNAESPLQYRGTNWMHLYVANKIISREKSYVIAYPLLRMRCLDPMSSRIEKKKQGDERHYMHAYVMLAGFVSGLKDQGISAAAQKIGGELIVKDNLFQIVSYKCIAERYDILYLFGVFKSLCSCLHLRKSPNFWMRGIPVLFLPRFCASAIYQWWQFKQKVAGWKGSPKKHERFLYFAYAAIRRVKQVIQSDSKKLGTNVL